MAAGKLVRDRIPELIEAEGRKPIVRHLSGEALLTALYAKLSEEHDELLTATSAEEKCEELADIVEVLITLAGHYGCDESELMDIVARKRADRGGFVKALFYEGDA